MVQLYIICMEITRCNNYDVYNGACGMFGSTGMIIHINAILNCVGLNAFCTHLIPASTTLINGTAYYTAEANDFVRDFVYSTS